MSVLRNIYLMIGFWGIVLCFVVQLLISTVLYLFKQDDKPLSFVATRFLLKIILGILGVRLKVHNEDLVPKDQGFILCANHASMLDIAVIILAVKCPIFFIAKRELGFVPILGWVMFMQGHYFINRKDRKKAYATLEKVKSNFKHNRSIMIFPEGTRTKTGEIGQFKKGAFKTAIESDAPILPCYIKGAHALFPKKAMFPKRGQIDCYFGELMPTDHLKEDPETMINLANTVQKKVKGLAE